ncbi:MAG TPA: hypothetical protein VE053_09015 [Allosphingosinicella sp.]|nr:hypothetical protein [Allosphingosinicella sp.]
MFVDRIEPRPGWSDMVAVRLLRRWVAIRAEGTPALPDLVAFGGGLGASAQVVVALASLFQLVEAALGRALAAECCCRVELGPDERAVLLLLASVPAAPAPGTSLAIPHGLPGALVWAVLSVRRLLEMDGGAADLVCGRCPFRAAD